MDILSGLSNIRDAITSLPVFLCALFLASVVALNERGFFRRLQGPVREVTKVVKPAVAPVLVYCLNLAAEAHSEEPAKWRVWISLQVGVMAAVGIYSFSGLYRLVSQHGATAERGVPLVPYLVVGLVASGVTLFTVGGFGMEEYYYALGLPGDAAEAVRSVPEIAKHRIAQAWP